jgi:hypothetical protein
MKSKSMVRLSGQVVVLALAVVTLSGCDVMVGMGGFGGRELAKDQWKKTYTLAAGGQLEIANTSGSIRTEATDGAQVEIVADRTARAATPEAAKEMLQSTEMREQTAPDRVSIEVKIPTRGNVEIEFVVKVPRSANLRLSNTNGKIIIAGAQGAVRADVTNGGVTGHALTGAVVASTTNGSIALDVDAVAKDGIKLGTTNGSIRLSLPASAQAEIKASCVNGGVSASNLTLEHQGSESRRRIDAKLNGGGARIDLETTNGGISITGR